MRQFVPVPKQHIPDLSLLDTLKMSSLSVSRRARRPGLTDILLALLPCFSICLWAVSLQHVSVQDMNDLGLISVLSPRIIVALGMLVVNFVFVLQRRELRPVLLALHIVFIILIIDGTQNLIEEMPRFAVVYRHAGYAEYIMRTGTVDTSLDAYFSWPIFFTLCAFVTKVAGYSTLLSYAGWAPVFFSLCYFGALYMIFTSITVNQRLVWLSILFFFLTNWIGQEYLSPQGLNFFLYLMMIAILLKWFKMPPKSLEHWQPGRQHLSFRQKFAGWLKAPDPLSTPLQSWQRRALLCCLIFIFGFVVSSHPLTPFFLLACVGALVIFRRCTPFWLPVLLAVMTAAWIFFVAGSFLAGHSAMVVGNLGDFLVNVSVSTTKRATVGDQQHQFVANLRLLMTGLIWLLALLGFMKRLVQRYRDITLIVLVGASLPLIAAQNYGGEMFLRIYLFTLPFIAFFAAALFCGKPRLVKRTSSPWMTAAAGSLVPADNGLRPTAARSVSRKGMTAAIIITNLVLLGGFFFTRYGNERVDYITYAEWDGVQQLYEMAPAHALLIQPTGDTPWQFENYEKYDYATLTNTNALMQAVLDADAGPIVQFINEANAPSTYIIFTRSQQAQFTAYEGEPGNTLARLEAALLASGEFQRVYSNPDAQILLFTGQI